MTGIGSIGMPLLSSDPTAGLGEKRQLDETQAQHLAQEFEGLFVSMLVKQMRQSVDGEGLFPGDSSDTYGGMFDMYLGQHLAQQGGIGLADQLHGLIARQMGSGSEG